MLDMCTIRDTRTGHFAKVPKDSKMRDQISMGASSDSIEDKTLTVAYGPDFVNVSFHNFCTTKKEIAKVIFKFQLCRIFINIRISSVLALLVVYYFWRQVTISN